MASSPIGPPPPPVAVPPSCDATPASSPTRGDARYPTLDLSQAASLPQSAAPGLVTPRHKKSSRLLARELGKGLKQMAHWESRCAHVQECVAAALTELETTLERAHSHQANNKSGLSLDVWSSERFPSNLGRLPCVLSRDANLALPKHSQRCQRSSARRSKSVQRAPRRSMSRSTPLWAIGR